MSDNPIIEESFDFENHKQKAINDYLNVRPLYEDFANILKDLIEKCLLEYSIKYYSVTTRAKLIKNFGEKACKPSDEDPFKPKYIEPLKNITDLTGVRIITYFPKTLQEVDKVLYQEFEVIEKRDKRDLLDHEEKLGYQSIHYLIQLKSSRCVLTEYKRFTGLTAEIQARTILQHTWAEIEHDIKYKSVITIPSSIKRRFMALAGLLEIADREFQSIQYDDEKNRKEARVSVQKGFLDSVEITPDALREYLNQNLGYDGRMTDFSYNFEAKNLIKMGFTNFKQIDDCIKNHNADKISRIVWGTRQGQLTRFELLLLAGMGENFFSVHPFAKEGLEWYINSCRSRLIQLEKAGIKIGSYNISKISK